MRVFLSAGEASGDAYAAALVREMRRLEAGREVGDPVEEIARTLDREHLHFSLYAPDKIDGLTLEDCADLNQALEEAAPDFSQEEDEEIPRLLERLRKEPLERQRAVLGALRLRYEGLGGPRLRQAGVETLADTSHWGAISIVQSVKVVPKVLFAYRRAKAALASGPPGLFVPIDFGFANIRLARHARSRHWKVLYFVPPGSWRRARQGRDLPQVTDAIVTPFSWSCDILRSMGANAEWYGHPIKQLLRENAAPAEAERTTLAILPGSRRHEVVENVPAIAEAVRDLPFRAEFALAPTTDAVALRRRWESLSGRRDDVFTVGKTGEVLRRARAGIVCSGTATLEAALCRCPMTVMYKVSRIVEMEEKVIGFKRPKFISLPNILLDRFAVPELIQEKASPEAIRASTERLLADSPERAAQLAAFEELDTLLGPADAITRAAELALQMTNAA